MFLGKQVLKICGKFTGEHTCQSAISIKMPSHFIEITIRHGCSPINFLHIFKIPFLRNVSEGLYLNNRDVTLIPYISKFFGLTLITLGTNSQPITHTLKYARPNSKPVSTLVPNLRPSYSSL